ncbi:MAG: 5-(carboxyamino)imidazole ribonucleotide mutase [Bacteroidia bacterium]|jgi:5-(carboxyamino)imidazole ribonucleotide mutase|nr:5-(carboxyamino)imidazole ribonucleotide mutase [Bacteroidia bacterium]MDG2041792.1 5-(carboxyamino)imidazole ribonucleotide mutase [Bacteroidia bacterium]|tara:strand:+ start:11461 stop:11973 length:513 start_codon:yes stop_codon:yes gene_type:complete
MADVLIIMGSDSDLKVMSEAAKFLDEVKVSYDLTVVSAHRTPDRMYNFAKEAKNKGYKTIIAGAGGAAHLPGMVASLTSLPVIGVPIQSKTMSGTDSLYSIVQMPPGIPVATMAINGAKNAGIFAARILGISQKDVAENLLHLKNSMKKMILEKAEELEQTGYNDYLKNM